MPFDSPRPLSIFLFSALAGLLLLFQGGGFLSALLGIRHRIASVATASFLLNPFVQLRPDQPMVLITAVIVCFCAGAIIMLGSRGIYISPGRTRAYSTLVFLVSMGTIVLPGFSLGAMVGSLAGLMGMMSAQRIVHARTPAQTTQNWHRLSLFGCVLNDPPRWSLGRFVPHCLTHLRRRRRIIGECVVNPLETALHLQLKERLNSYQC